MSSSPPLELRQLKTKQRGRTQIATCEVVLLDLLIIPEVQIHRKDGACWVRLPAGLKWRNQRVAERFRAALLTLIGYEHPNLLKGLPELDRGPLLRHLAASSSPQLQRRGNDYGQK
jgi:hypothetical protein